MCFQLEHFSDEFMAALAVCFTQVGLPMLQQRRTVACAVSTLYTRIACNILIASRQIISCHVQTFSALQIASDPLSSVHEYYGIQLFSLPTLLSAWDFMDKSQF